MASDTRLIALAAIRFALQGDDASLRLLLEGCEPDDLASAARYLARTSAWAIQGHHGGDVAAATAAVDQCIAEPSEA